MVDGQAAVAVFRTDGLTIRSRRLGALTQPRSPALKQPCSPLSLPQEFSGRT